MAGETSLIPQSKEAVVKGRPRGVDDLLWKAIIEDVSTDFLRFFFPDADLLFDLDRKLEYLDKEFDPLFPHMDDAGGVRYVDKLVKVFLKDGAEKWISLHVEVQNQRGKEDFSSRMLRYWYLMKEKFSVSITALAILTSGNKNFRPQPYVEEYLGTRLTYEYNVYKILDQNEADLRANPNPFSVVILVALSAIKHKNVDDVSLKKIKHELNYELTKRNLEEPKHNSILNFIKYYVKFKSPEMMSIFEQEADQLLGKTTTMGTEEYLFHKFREEGIQAGIETGIQTGIQTGEARGRHAEALEIASEMKRDMFPVETISKLTKLSIREIEVL